VKNVAGYDMMKLLIGSQGTLAVITSASFKLFPAPRQTRTFVAVFPTAAEAIAFRHYVLRSPLDPICLELISPQAHDLVPTHSPSPAGWAICVRASGSDKVLARYRKELGTEVLREIEGDEELAFWRGLADFAPLLKERHPSSLLLSMSLPLNGVQTALSDFGSFAEANGFRMAAIGRVGLGHLCVAFWAGQNPEGAKSDFGGALTGLRGRLPLGASMTVLHAPPELREPIALWGPTPTDVASMGAVKAALDPNDVLNRGRLLF
jgi:FAD/FMN-containing dehydrogenase